LSVVKTLRVMKVPETLGELNFIHSTGLTATSTDAVIIKNASILFYFIARACSGIFVCFRVWRRREVPKITHAFTLLQDICSIGQSGLWRQLNGVCIGRVNVPVFRVIAMLFLWCRT